MREYRLELPPQASRARPAFAALHSSFMQTAAPDSPGLPHPTDGTLAVLRTAAADIKLAHSVFALPFAVLAAFLARDASSSWARFAGQLGLVVLCMVLARSFAMVVNRFADRSFDARNTRTARRAFASGRITVAQGLTLLVAMNALFLGACALFGVCFANWWPLILAEPVLAFLAFYSYTKRFTWACHLVLGLALALSPVAATIAIDPGALRTVPAVWYLAGMVALWVAGFDVIYALQDIAFDRSEGLKSIPARLGWRGAAWVSRLLHTGAFALLVMACRSEPRFGMLFGAAVALVGALLVTEHVVLARRGEKGLDMAFFTLNGVVSLVLGAAGCADTLL